MMCTCDLLMRAMMVKDRLACWLMGLAFKQKQAINILGDLRQPLESPYFTGAENARLGIHHAQRAEDDAVIQAQAHAGKAAHERRSRDQTVVAETWILARIRHEKNTLVQQRVLDKSTGSSDFFDMQTDRAVPNHGLGSNKSNQRHRYIEQFAS